MPHGDGRIFKRGPIWWIAYSVAGKEFRETTRSTEEDFARQLLTARVEQRQRTEAAAILKPRTNPKFKKLAAAYLLDCTLRGLRSLSGIKKSAKRLCEFFAWIKPEEINHSGIRGYQKLRLEQGASGGTVNRETGTLSGMLNLAWLNEIIERRPKFPPCLKEATPRQGFFEHPHYLSIRGHLVDWAQDVLDFAYYTGWRRTEIIWLTWTEVFEDEIRLSPERSKNNEGRPRPIWGAIALVMERRRRARRMDCPYVFHRDGTKIATATWQRHWSKARKAAGLPNALLHDCRRTAVRNLIRAGVPERIAMQMTGHKTRAVFDRYNIVDERDLIDASKKLSDYISTQPTESRVVPFRR